VHILDVLCKLLLHALGIVGDHGLSLVTAFRNSDKESLYELERLPLLAKLSLFPPGKLLLHWVSFPLETDW